MNRAVRLGLLCAATLGLSLALSAFAEAASPGAASPEVRPPAQELNSEQVIARARVLLKDSDFAAAEDTLRSGLLRWPEHHDLHLLAGWAATWGGRVAVGAQDFLAATRLAPESLDAWDGLAYAYSLMGRSAKSREALHRAQALDTDPRARDERALRVRWASGDIAGAQIAARALAATDGASPITDSVTTSPMGFDARVWMSMSFRQEAPLARVGTELRMQPHRLLRFSLSAEGSTWLGDRELSLRGGAQLLTPAGFSLVLFGGGGIPGVREPKGIVGVGLGWRFARIVEVEAGWTFHRWAAGTTLHLLRLGALLDLPWGTRLGGAFYLGLIRPHQDPTVRPAPGGRIYVVQLVLDPISVEGGYSVGTEIIVDPATATERALITHELKLGLRLQLTARLGFSAAYALQAWSGLPPFHGLSTEFRALW